MIDLNSSSLHLYDPQELSKSILDQVIKPKPDSEESYYSISAKQTLPIVLQALHLVGSPFSLNDVKDALVNEDQLIKLKDHLISKHKDAEQTKSFEALIEKYTLNGQFSHENFMLVIAGLINQLFIKTQTTNAV